MVCISPHITSVTVQPPNTVVASYETSERRALDVSGIIKGPFMGKLASPAYFKTVQIIDDGTTIGWPDGQDIDPCWLYEEGRSL